jgi:hypothetical protein
VGAAAPVDFDELVRRYRTRICVFPARWKAMSRAGQAGRFHGRMDGVDVAFGSHQWRIASLGEGIALWGACIPERAAQPACQAGRGLAEASKLLIFDARPGHVGATPQPKQTVASHANQHRRCRKPTVPTSAAPTNLFWKALTR